MNDNYTKIFFLALLGVGAYYLGSKKNLKEDFDGFSLASVQVQDLAVPTGKGTYTTMSVPQTMYPALKGIQEPSVTLQVGKPSGFSKAVVFPGPNQPSPAIPTQDMSNKTSVTLPASFLGSSAVTNSPYISQPNYMQSANRNIQQGNVQFSSWQYAAPPPADIMGMSPPCDDSSCNGRGSAPPLKEGYEATDKNPWGPDFKGVGYSAGNYNALAGYAPCEDTTTVDNVQMLSASDPFAASGNAQSDIYNYTRNMTTTKGTSTRTNRYSNTRDLIRGDLPIAPTSGSNTTSLFGYGSSNSTYLNMGSLQHMGGESESTATMKNFMKAYGKTTYEPKPLPQMVGQTLPQLMATTQANKIGGGDTTVINFA